MIPTTDTDTYPLGLCRVFEEAGVEILAVDYCSSHDKIDYSYLKNSESGFISFAAEERDLNIIPAYPPEPFGSSRDISNITEAANFLYLINGENFPAKADLTATVSQTDFDVLIIDLFHNEQAWTAAEITRLARPREPRLGRLLQGRVLGKRVAGHSIRHRRFISEKDN